MKKLLIFATLVSLAACTRENNAIAPSSKEVMYRFKIQSYDSTATFSSIKSVKQ